MWCYTFADGGGAVKWASALHVEYRGVLTHILYYCCFWVRSHLLCLRGKSRDVARVSQEHA